MKIICFKTALKTSCGMQNETYIFFLLFLFLLFSLIFFLQSSLLLLQTFVLKYIKGDEMKKRWNSGQCKRNICFLNVHPCKVFASLFNMIWKLQTGNIFSIKTELTKEALFSITSKYIIRPPFLLLCELFLLVLLLFSSFLQPTLNKYINPS